MTTHDGIVLFIGRPYYEIIIFCVHANNNLSSDERKTNFYFGPPTASPSSVITHTINLNRILLSNKFCARFGKYALR